MNPHATADLDETTVTAADYARAEQMLAPYRARRVPGAALQPQWLPDGHRFWYQVEARFVLVDPRNGSRDDAFDHDRLAAALSVASGHAANADDLPISAVEFGDDDMVGFTAFGSRWVWSPGTGTCERDDASDRALPWELESPDKSWVAFRRDGNIWVRSRDGEREIALSDDAEPHVEYGGVADATGGRALMRVLGLPPLFAVQWSPDSTRILA